MRYVLIVLLALQQSTTPILDGLMKEIASLRAPVPPPAVVTEIAVPAGADLQKALDAALPGQTLALAQGAVYKVNLLLRNRTTAGVVTLRTAGLDDTVLPPGVRVKPFLADGTPDPTVAKMAKLVCLDCLFPAIAADAGAHDYTFIGIEVAGNVPHPDRDLIQFGVDTKAGTWAKTFEEQPLNLTFDRMYIHGEPGTGGHRGILADGRNLKIVNSDLRNFWEQGRDSQAIGCSQAKGPLLIQNNYIEASGENVMCGGNDPTIANAVPADIDIFDNLVSKPLAWRPVYRSTAGVLSNAWSDGAVLVSGKPGSVKNLFELKNATRVHIRGNVFENNWADAQSGSAAVLNVRNQDGTCPWCTVSHVLFECNTIRNSQDNAAFNILATDNHFPSVTMEDVVIKNNLIDGVARGLLLGGVPNAKGLVMTGNVFLRITNSLLALDGGQMDGFVFSGNFAQPGTYGIFGNGVGVGVIALNTYANGTPPWVFTGNTIETAPFTSYPPGQTMVAPGTITASAWKCP